MMDATGRLRSCEDRRPVRKRSLSLVGLLLPSIMSVEATRFAQHHVRAPGHTVSNFESWKIPSDLSMLHDEAESKTRTDDVEFIWDLHVDASMHPSPDKVFDDIRRGRRRSEVQKELRTIRRAVVSTAWFTRQRELSATKVPFLDDSFFNESSVSPLDANSTEGSFFNASIGMEYQVELEGEGINRTTVNDSTSTLFATVDSTPTEDSNDGASTTSKTNHTAQFRPLRMRAFLSELAGGGQHLDPDQRTDLLVDMIKPALLAWSAALRVESVEGQNLTIDRGQLVDGISCGPGGSLPSVIVPTEHLTHGVADTDFVLYISLAFQGGNYTNTTDEDAQSSPPNDADTLADKKLCFGDFLAASAFCSTDKNDRPTAAILHLCIGDSFFDDDMINMNIMIVLHELGHALGFNAVSLAHFRRPDGTPYTKRNETGEIPLTETECTGPVGQRKKEMVALPSTDVLNFRTVRGIRVAEIVTPSVRQVIRNHFGCQELSGAELESGEFLPLSTNSGEASCLGDHWERRLFKTDLMNPIIDRNVEFNPRFSSITLAFFADSGWYQVDLSRTSLSAGWGRAAGCAFVEETCIHIEDGQVPATFNSFFCDKVPSTDSGFVVDMQGCTTDMTRKAACSMERYEGELPREYQYFNFKYGSNMGGTDAFMDYCPVYEGFPNGLCSDSANEAVIKLNVIERVGKRNSRCLSGTTSRRLNTADGASSLSPSPSSEDETTALCLPIACVVEDQSLRIQVDGVWKTCYKKDEVIVVPRAPVNLGDGVQENSEVISVICPDPIRTCPTFYCNRDCLGTNRLCDYNVGKCVCNSTKVYNDYKTWNETSFSGLQYRKDNENEICGTPNGTAEDGGSRSFYQPHGQDDSGLPTPDSPLSEYYYDSERSLLESDNFWSNRWKSITIGTVSAASLILALLAYWVIRYRPRATLENGEDSGDDPADAAEEINPDKHKLMASIVVNIRMNDPNRRPRDALANRDSETELSMTETEGTLDQPSLEEFFFDVPMSEFVDGTMVDLSSCDDFASRLRLDDGDRDYIDPLAPPSATPVVRRRRHLFSSSFL